MHYRQEKYSRILMRLLILFSLLLMQGMARAETHTVTYYIPDAQGSPIVAIDRDGGTVKWRKHYKPYGEEIEQGAASTGNRIGYTGHVHDRASGLTYMGARYYDPYRGQFNSMDAAAVDPNDPRTFNRYAYGYNAPYNYVDPDGNAPQWILVPKAKASGWSLRGLDAGYGPGMGANGRLATGRQFENRSYKQIIDDWKKIEAENLASVAKRPLWTSTKSKSAVENAFGHWKKHKGEFPEFQNAKQYVEGTQKFLNSPPKGTLSKTRSNGDTLLYDPKTNTFGVKDAKGAPRTMFRPKDGLDYWNKQ